ncbi:MAG TPA: segregation/condensation protein A [Actinomycetota bacterium]|nr:segregation/condensation protein A [Actinomycetota bacterium]
MSSASRAEQLTVELPVFSGPFRLLADLILDHKVDVCDVPVARVTDRFLALGAEEAAAWSIEEATWFLATCAVLLELKVGRLLPRQKPDTEEELLGGASPDLVYARSLELTAYRQISADLAERMATAALLVPRTAGPPPEFAHLYPDPLERVTSEVLAGIAAELLAPEPPVDLSHVTPIRVTLADAIDAVRERMALQREARFQELVEGCRDRIEVVVRFLALLELHRDGKVRLAQARVFGDIEVTWQGEEAA